MDAAIRAYLTDEYIVDRHSQTYAALERLIPGNSSPADVVLAVKYYDDTLQDVMNRGTDLIITPIAKEGFVFVVHKDNPIDGLTQQQLRDIYSGKITNWKEVGGNDEVIIPFVRNTDSGSQTAMTDFMSSLSNAESVGTEVDSMLGVFGMISMKGSAAIGYNIYSWSMEQWINADNIKLLAVDNISPSNETLADDSYPLRVYTYSYYNNGNDKGKNLTAWLLTAEGQKVIASAGYVGIFGEVPTRERINFNKDEGEARKTLEAYYTENGWKASGFLHFRLPDRAQAVMLADGKAKDVTVLYYCKYQDTVKYSGVWGLFTCERFIVLTRDRGGTFEVVNEGKVSSYTDGIIIPGNTSSHHPPI